MIKIFDINFWCR